MKKSLGDADSALCLSLTTLPFFFFFFPKRLSFAASRKPGAWQSISPDGILFHGGAPVACGLWARAAEEGLGEEGPPPGDLRSSPRPTS